MDHLEKSMLCPYICFYSPDESTCTVGKKGLQSLISASDQRGDGLKDQFDTILDHMQQDGLTHCSCIKCAADTMWSRNE